MPRAPENKSIFFKRHNHDSGVLIIGVSQARLAFKREIQIQNKCYYLNISLVCISFIFDMKILADSG